MQQFTEQQIELLINALAYYRGRVENQHPDTIHEVDNLLRIFRDEKWARAKTQPKNQT
jgi:hypothetical protein